jgi:hypothetical protein
LQNDFQADYNTKTGKIKKHPQSGGVSCGTIMKKMKLEILLICLILYLSISFSWVVKADASKEPSPSPGASIIASPAPEISSPTPTPSPENKYKDVKGNITIKLPGNVKFNEVEVSTTNIVQKVAFEESGRRLRIIDERSAPVGWTVTVSGEDLKDSGEQIEVTNLKFNPLKFQIMRGSEEGIVLGKGRNFLNKYDQIMVIRANQNHGLGMYEVYNELELTIPANISAGNYTGKLVFTIQ